MKVIAFFNVKGGVGKTTSAINISYNIASMYSKSVLLIDTDPQSNASYFYDTSDNDIIIEDVLRGYKEKEMFKREISIEQAITKTKFDGLDMIGTRPSLWSFEKEVMEDSAEQQYKLKNSLNKISHKYDYVIIDCSNVAESLININVFVASDYIFIPLKDESWATKGMLMTLDVIKSMNNFNPSLKLGGCFYCHWEDRKVNKISYDSLNNFLGDKLLDTKIRKNKSVSETSYTQVPLLLYDKHGRATQDYVALTKKIMKIVSGI